MILNLIIENQEIIDFLSKSKLEDRDNVAIHALQVGCCALSRISVSNDLEYVDKKITNIMMEVDHRFKSLDLSLKSLIEDRFNPENSSSFLSKANTIVVDQASKISYDLKNIVLSLKDKMDPNNSSGYISTLINQIKNFENSLESQFSDTDSKSFIFKLKQSVDDHFGEEGLVISSINEQLSINGNTPLNIIYSSLKSEISSLRDILMKTMGKQELLQQSTKKGFIFEDVLESKLEEIAKPYGDIIDNVSLVVENITGSKKGDYLYSFGKEKIVLDAKSHKKIGSLRGMLSYIDDAISCRDANFGIIVVPTEDTLQKQIGTWNIYDNKIITTIDALEISIKYAKSFIKITSSGSQIDSKNLHSKIESLARKIKEFVAIKTKLTKMSNGIVSSIEEISKSVEVLHKDMKDSLSEIEKLL